MSNERRWDHATDFVVSQVCEPKMRHERVCNLTLVYKEVRKETPDTEVVSKIMSGKEGKRTVQKHRKIHRNTWILTLLTGLGMNTLAIEIWHKNTYHDPCHWMSESEKNSRCFFTFLNSEVNQALKWLDNMCARFSHVKSLHGEYLPLWRYAAACVEACHRNGWVKCFELCYMGDMTYQTKYVALSNLFISKVTDLFGRMPGRRENV